MPGVVRTLLGQIERDQFDINVCTVRPPADDDRMDELGIGLEFHNLSVRGASPSRIRRAAAALRLTLLLRRWQPDVIHVHSGLGWYLLPWIVFPGRHCPVILEVHDSPQSGRVSKLNGRAEQFLLRHRSVCALVHSASVGRDLMAVAPHSAGSLHIIPIGITTSEFGDAARGVAWRRDRHIDQAESVVTYVARLVPSKNPQLFVQVAAEVTALRPRVRFVLAGNGPEKAAVMEEAERLGLSDRLLVVGQEPDLSGVLAATDVFLSTSAYEGFGIAILEAMASSTPVVARAVGGIPELVDPGTTGVLVPADDAGELVAAVVGLIDDDGARLRMGLAARARAVELFDARRMTEKYESLYQALAQKQRPDSPPDEEALPARRHLAGRTAQLSAIASFVWSHPANRTHRFTALRRALTYQVATSVLRRSYVAQLGYSSRVIVRPNHCEVESNVVYAGLPDWAEMRAWQMHLKRGDLFIDVGASIGPYTLWACELGARAVAIEPSQSMLKRLRANVALNGYDVDIVPAAVGDTSGIGFTQLAGEGSETVCYPEARVVTIDEILGNRTAAGMKVDVEGAEILVLRGAKRALAERRIKLIQLEWNNTSLYLRRETREPVAKFLHELGYDLFRAEGDGRFVRVEDTTAFGPDVFAVAPDYPSSVDELP